MGKSNRKLTDKELRRKEKFEKLSNDMLEKGYQAKVLTVGIVQANVGAFFIMLPFMIMTTWFYYIVNREGVQELSLRFSLLLFLLLLLLIVLHELIHGITWGIFAKNHFRSIRFGIIWSALTPYCTCSEPMNQWQYLSGSAMPTLLLGFGMAVVATVTGQFLLFILSEIMILSGGGDFLIILKILLYRSGKKEKVYCDHPYECGVVVFEK